MLNPEQLVGEQIKQYRLKAHIDRGGMADVYLAYDENLQRQVALKIMLPAFAHDKQFVERFWREARTAARLDHVNIVQVYEISNTPDQRPYIAMQYIDGGSLKDKLQTLDGRLFPVAEALSIMRQITVALGVAHNADIVHRDIKPSNILLRPDGTPVLVDLGIAAVQSGPKLTQTGTLIGTPHYMSPEQVSGGGVDGRSDIYSLGVVLYELLCGSRPFEADDSLAILHKHVYEKPQPLPERRSGLTQETYRLVDICLQKDPNQRYQTTGELIAAIERALAAEDRGPSLPAWQPTIPDTTSPMDFPPPIQPDEAKGRSWWLLALIPVLLLLGAAAVGGVYYLFFAPDNDGITPTPPEQFIINDDETATSPPAPTTEPPTLTDPADTEEAVTPVPPPTEVPPTDTVVPSTEPPPPTNTPDLGPETLEIGRSVQNRPLEAVRFGGGDKSIILVGGLHAGAAPGSVTLAERTISHFRANPGQIPPGATLYIVISASPDSPYAPGQLSGRLNANGVDLNRNWDCRWTEDAKWRGNVVEGSGGLFPFSEPETDALITLIQDTGAEAIVFWEARAAAGLSSPGACGDRSLVSGRLAQVYGLAAGYPIADFENLTNQELNGDSTNWLDLQGIPAIAVLLPDYEDVDWNNNLDGIMAVLDEYGR